MKAKSFQITALSSQLKNTSDVVLLYGNDDGEIIHTLSQLKQILGISSKSNSLISLTKDNLKKTPFLATDEANTPSLIATRRFIFIDADIDFSVNALNHFLDNKKTDSLLIINGGNLSKSNSLRIEAEKHPRILAISCYEPKIQDIQRNILTFFQTYHKAISQEVLNEFCKNISFNQQVIQQELQKLLLYIGNNSQITLEDVRACLTNSSESSLDDLCVALADGHIESVQNLISLFLHSGDSETTLFWAVRDYFSRLLFIINDHSDTLQNIIKKHLKAHQFSFELPLLKQAQRWNNHAILTVLQKLTELEQKTRTAGYPKDTLISQTFLELALLSKNLS